jgi:hypothetical protein
VYLFVCQRCLMHLPESHKQKTLLNAKPKQKGTGRVNASTAISLTEDPLRSLFTLP